MDCKEFELMIPDFIDRKMDYPSLKRFREHVNCCGECREELTIQFLVREGVQRLEDGGAFDLQSELEQRLEEAERKVRLQDGFLYVGIVLEFLVVGLLAGVIVWILL